jgi:hypothetical protein
LDVGAGTIWLLADSLFNEGDGLKPEPKNYESAQRIAADIDIAVLRVFIAFWICMG